jgi:hypothetical protein
MLDTFDFGAFVTDSLRIEGPTAYSSVKIIYIHWGTGERLNVRFRFNVTQRDGKIVHIDEFHDAAFLEAFSRFVGIGTAP